jgi:two-component system LytT family response regulator
MKIKSLIIDDDPFIKSLLVDMIMIHFPNVEILDTAKNGKGGIEKIEIHQPDLIFLDVEMTDMTGFEMLSHYENPPF